MIKKSKKIITIIIIACLCIMLIGAIYKVHAMGINAISDPNQYISSEVNTDQRAVQMGNVIVWVIRTVGQLIAVAMLLIIGTKYVLGSVEQKAEYKQTMWPYIIGAALIFGGASLTDLIYNAFN